MRKQIFLSDVLGNVLGRDIAGLLDMAEAFFFIGQRHS